MNTLPPVPSWAPPCLRRLSLALLLAGCDADAATSESAPVTVKETWVQVDGGTFEMGTAKSEFCRRETVGVHNETVEGFEIQTFEVTQLQFESAMGYNPSFASTCDTCPVDSISWHEAAAYANALAARDQQSACYVCTGSHERAHCTPVETCDGPRLPTEAQWEYAARAGTHQSTYAGRITSCMSSDEVADRIAWYKANSTGNAQSVGRLEPNPWGLHDVLGNIAEWTQVVDSEGYGVLRGGSWYHNAERSRAAGRLRAPADRALSYAGVRLVRPIAQKAKAQ